MVRLLDCLAPIEGSTPGGYTFRENTVPPGEHRIKIDEAGEGAPHRAMMRCLPVVDASLFYNMVFFSRMACWLSRVFYSSAGSFICLFLYFFRRIFVPSPSFHGVHAHRGLRALNL